MGKKQRPTWASRPTDESARLSLLATERIAFLSGPFGCLAAIGRSTDSARPVLTGRTRERAGLCIAGLCLYPATGKAI